MREVSVRLPGKPIKYNQREGVEGLRKRQEGGENKKERKEKSGHWLGQEWVGKQQEVRWADDAGLRVCLGDCELLPYRL